MKQLPRSPGFVGPLIVLATKLNFAIFSIHSGYLIQWHKNPTAMRGSEAGKGEEPPEKTH